MTRKKLSVLMAMGLILLGLGALPAAADAPTRFFDSITFPDINPCTGLEQLVTINFDFSEHQGHPHNFVGHVKRTGTTDSGYVMDHGVETFVANENVVRGEQTDIWYHENGSMFIAQGVFVIDLGTGEILVNLGGLECIRN